MILRCLLAVMLASASLAHAQQYRWTDAAGRVHYGDAAPPGARNIERLGARPGAAAAAAVQASAQANVDLARAQKEFPATLYTSPSCKLPCESARAALNRRAVPFEEVQVWNPETIEVLKAKTGADNVPALLLGERVLIGFEQGQQDAFLDAAGYPKAGLLPARAQATPPAPEGYEAPAGEAPKQEAESRVKAGPYDASTLPSNRPDKPGPDLAPDPTK
jgi:glutaredoxin